MTADVLSSVTEEVGDLLVIDCDELHTPNAGVRTGSRIVQLVSKEVTVTGYRLELLDMGPEFVLIKKGANGSILFGKDGSIFMLPAYPVEVVHDPTGAGDSFAGALMGYLAREDATDTPAIRRAILQASVVASFGVEQFSLDRLQALDVAAIENRALAFVKMTQL